MSEEDAEKLFLQEKPTLALLFIGFTEKTYASVISKEIDSTFAHTTRILSKMEECGLIRFTYEGRIKYVELTEYGKRVETSLKEFRDLLREADLVGGEIRKLEATEAAENIKNIEDIEATRNIKELDPVNAGILEKIQALQSRIEKIYREAVERGEGQDSISRKLGPFSRDIKKLRDQIEKAGGKEGGEVFTPIDETVTYALGKTFEFLESCLGP
ncbi:MAG: MarR family transcriptional regulator [Methanosarcinaceae archaeon]|nr:MarR family transcriptional regulator [Methanosarcinaceae archaeon]MDD4498730.1 MarR family transcriptional regulator [Methanosarcinaceae archaeon]